MPSSSFNGDNDGGHDPSIVSSTPMRPVQVDRDADDDEEEDEEEDCWIPTPSAARTRSSAAAAPGSDSDSRAAAGRASSSEEAAGPHMCAASNGPDGAAAADAAADGGPAKANGDADDASGVPSSDAMHATAGGSIRRRLASETSSNAAATTAGSAAQPIIDANDTDVSLLDSLNAALAPPLLSALLFLTKTSLSTTTHLLAPPLHLTRTVLLPALCYGLVDLWEATAPPRLKDWSSILTQSLRHLRRVLVASRASRRFRAHTQRAGGAALDAAAAPAARRLLVEGTAALIRAAEALRTPEVRALLDQLGAVVQRAGEAAATDEARRLAGDGAAWVWAGIEVAASEDAAVGLAECCAYLCHALEMEHGVWREGRGRSRSRTRGSRSTGRRGGGGGDGDGGSRRRRQEDGGDDDGRAEAARRRRERARRSIAGGGGGGGIEGAILRSLGDADRVYGRNGGDGDDGADESAAAAAAASRHDVDDVDGTMSLPSRVVVESPTGGWGGGDGLGDGLEPPSTGGKDDACSSIGSGGDHADHGDGDGDDDDGMTNEHGGDGAPKNSSFANEACDVDFLRRRISQRARTMEVEQKRHRALQQQGRADGDSGVVDIEEASSNVSEFYRLVDQISSERQAEAISGILDEEEGRTAAAAAAGRPSRRRFYPRAAAAAGAGNEQGQDTLKTRLEAYVSRRSRERAGIGVGGEAPRPTQRRTGGILGNRMVVWALILWFLLGCAIIGGFSCYGIYIFVFAPATPLTMASVPLLKGLVRAERRGTPALKSPSATMPRQSSPVPTEIVVRIVREVVHVTPDGNAYVGSGAESYGGDDTSRDEADTAVLEEKIAEAAVGAIQNIVARTGLEEEEANAEL